MGGARGGLGRGVEGGGEKNFKFTLDTPLRGGHEIVYNCVVFWEDCRLASAGRLSRDLVRTSADNESVWELNIEARRSSGKTN